MIWACNIMRQLTFFSPPTVPPTIEKDTSSVWLELSFLPIWEDTNKLNWYPQQFLFPPFPFPFPPTKQRKGRVFSLPFPPHFPLKQTERNQSSEKLCHGMIICNLMMIRPKSIICKGKLQFIPNLVLS